MKVVQIVTQMEAAGAQEVAYQLHEGLSRKGHNSELWFLCERCVKCILRGNFRSSIVEVCESVKKQQGGVGGGSFPSKEGVVRV